MSGWARRERAALVELLRRLGPDAPTACTGWSTADLAAHLYIRERRIDAAPGVVAGGPFGAHAERVMASVLRVHGYEAVVDRVAAGPPLLWRPLDEQLNLFEYFVHHEDVRRANGEGPRDLPGELEQVLWLGVRRSLRLSMRRVRDVRVEIDAERGGGAAVGRGPVVTVRGAVGEVMLLTFNRKEIAQVKISGDAAAVERFKSARLGLI